MILKIWEEDVDILLRSKISFILDLHFPQDRGLCNCEIDKIGLFFRTRVKLCQAAVEHFAIFISSIHWPPPFDSRGPWAISWNGRADDTTALFVVVLRFLGIVEKPGDFRSRRNSGAHRPWPTVSRTHPWQLVPAVIRFPRGTIRPINNVFRCDFPTFI